MNSFIYVLTTISLYKTAELHFMKTLTNKIFSDPKIYQTIILKDNDDTDIDFVLQRITREKPSILINLGESEIVGQQQATNLQVSLNSRSSSMFIVLLNGKKEEELIRRVELAFKEIMKFSPNSVRPRCLLIHVGKSSLSDADVLNIFQKASSLQFWDFLIFNYRQNDFNLCVYNPFTEELSTVKSLSSTESLFPIKFTNMGKFKFKVGYTYIPTFMEMKKDPKTGELKLKTMDNPYVQIISEELNLPIKYVDINFDINSPRGNRNLNLLDISLMSSDIHIFPMQFMVGSQIYGHNCTLGRFTKDTWYVFMVPIMSAFRVNVPVEWLYFFAIVYGFVVVSRLLKFVPRDWGAIHTLQVFLGGTPLRSPEEFKHRMVYLNLVLLSILCGSSIYSEVMETKMTSDEVPFHTIEEIRSSGLPVYASRNLEESTNTNDTTLSNVRSTFTGWSDATDCTRRLERYGDCICFVPVVYADNVINRSKNRMMKIAKPSFIYDKSAFCYPIASPFAEKFDNTLQKIIESGIEQSYNFFDSLKPRAKKNSTGKISVKQLLMILLFGLTLAFLAFIVEVIIRKLCVF